MRLFRFAIGALVTLSILNAARADSPPTSAPSAGLTVGTTVADQSFDPSEHLLGDSFKLRSTADAHGIDIEPFLIIDYSKNFMGGLDTSGDSFRERFNLPIQIDTEKLFDLHGGTIFAVYQLQHGGNASHELTGDAQNFAFGTDADGRSQLGQLWYEQKFFDDTVRVRIGKQDGNTDFDVLDNAQDFLNNSFSTSPTLALMPSFPDNGMGVQAFWEPKGGFYLGAGVFDGSGARGIRTGEYGPAHFFDRGDDLFLIAETGKRYKLRIGDRHFPGKLSVGGWWDTNPFERIDGDGTRAGTCGVYLTLDQILWKPRHEQPVPAGPGEIASQPEEENYPGGIASSFSISWCDPEVNRIDANALAGLTWTGALPSRPIDVWGAGFTTAHFSEDADTRNACETAFETFYRIRFTKFVSLKPDLQYIVHPSGSGIDGGEVICDALVMTMRLEVSF